MNKIHKMYWVFSSEQATNNTHKDGANQKAECVGMIESVKSKMHQVSCSKDTSSTQLMDSGPVGKGDI